MIRRIVPILLISVVAHAPMDSATPQLAERQLTHGDFNHDLDDNVNFSPDGTRLVYDCRDERGIGANGRIGVVDVRTGAERIVYEQKGEPIGVGAASFLNNDEIVAIHALEPPAGDSRELDYDFTVRGGMIISADGSGKRRWLDSRNVLPPFTPGALRGGTHKHEPDGTGEWVGFTYNDAIMKARGSDLRNVGASRRGLAVKVPQDRNGRNFTGESFSVLLTACTDHPAPGSDEYSRAEGDCWIGRDGFFDRDGKRRRARAFRGLVAVREGDLIARYSDLFLVTVPDDITKPGPLGPVEGTTSDYPKPPAGTVVRRLTRTAEAKDPALRGISGHVRASADGQYLTYVGKNRERGRVVDRLFVVTPSTGLVRRLTSSGPGVIWDPRFSPNGKFVACARDDGSVGAVSVEPGSWAKVIGATAPANGPVRNVVVSPDSSAIAYNRVVGMHLQVFIIHLF